MQLWTDFINKLELQLGEPAVAKWMRPLKVIHFDARNLYLEGDDPFVLSWFDEHVRPRLGQFTTSSGRPIKVHISVEENHKSKAPPVIPKFELEFDRLDPLATFDSFVKINGNRLAFELLSQLGRQVELGCYNPIFLYGVDGVGKSHLAMATASHLQSIGLKTLFVRGDQFTQHVVSAIRSGSMDLFRSTYRAVDALIIDDVQAVANKGATQEELFHTFNTLHIEGKQLIFSATAPPTDLKAIEPRLISRFEWGLTLPMETPSHEEMKQIAQQKAAQFGLTLSAQVVSFLLESFGRNPQPLSKAITSLALKGSETPSIFEAQRLLIPLIEEEKIGSTSPEKVVEEVAGYYGMEKRELLGKSQKREASLPRQIAMFICRKYLHLPFATIGELFTRNHSTVMTSVKQVQKCLDKGADDLPAIVQTIRRRL